jgi:hypothetical protein
LDETSNREQDGSKTKDFLGECPGGWRCADQEFASTFLLPPADCNIDRVENLSIDEFRRVYEGKKPVIFFGEKTSFELDEGEWTKENLLGDNRPVRVGRSESLANEGNIR